MGQLEEGLERTWRSWQISITLPIIGAALAIWALSKTPSPGMAIAILGAAAAIMSLRPEMRPFEKAAWMLIISGLLLAEVHSIRKSDAQNFRDREDQISRLKNLTNTSKEISNKIDLFAPKSTIVPVAHAQGNSRSTPAKPGSTEKQPLHNEEDQRLIEQLKGLVAANKPWGMTQDQLVALSRTMSAYASVDDHGDLITAAMNDPESEKFAAQLVGAFRAAGWKLPGSGMNLALFSNPVVGVHVVITSRDANPPGLREFIQNLRGAGIEPIGELDPHQSPSQFRIIVGGRPN